jgi:hypothetical protein
MPTSITREELQFLAAPITETEVAKAIASLNPNKASGPDGLGGSFYQIHNARLVPFLTKLLNHFLKGAAIPPAIKEAMITTIYKGKGDPLDISNRRPIALLNVDYKILSKIINHRILCLLPRLILPNQTGFVPGRSVFDKIVTMNVSFDFNPKKRFNDAYASNELTVSKNSPTKSDVIKQSNEQVPQKHFPTRQNLFLSSWPMNPFCDLKLHVKINIFNIALILCEKLCYSTLDFGESFGFSSTLLLVNFQRISYQLFPILYAFRSQSCSFQLLLFHFWRNKVAEVIQKCAKETSTDAQSDHKAWSPREDAKECAPHASSDCRTPESVRIRKQSLTKKICALIKECCGPKN